MFKQIKTIKEYKINLAIEKAKNVLLEAYKKIKNSNESKINIASKQQELADTSKSEEYEDIAYLITMIDNNDLFPPIGVATKNSIDC